MTIDDTRFATLLPPSIRSLPVTIIGCGGTGAALARQLAYTGFTTLTLIDFDTIEPHNLGPQGWSAAQLGLTKVAALSAELLAARPSLSITTHTRRWSAAHDLRSCTPIVCSCVDSRDTDAFIASKIIPHLSSLPSPYLYLSPRVRAIDYVLRSIFDAPSYASYLSTHFPDAAVAPEPSGCGVPTTLYGNTTLACLMLDNIRRRFTSLPVITYAQRSFHTPPACWLHEEADQDTPTQGVATPPTPPGRRATILDDPDSPPAPMPVEDALLTSALNDMFPPSLAAPLPNLQPRPRTLSRMEADASDPDGFLERSRVPLPQSDTGTLHESTPTQIPTDLPF